MLSLGEAVHYVRQKRGMSARALSEAIGKSTSYVSKLEADQLDPSFQSFAAIVRALKLSDAEILFLVGIR